jgi:hypothetical protein
MLEKVLDDTSVNEVHGVQNKISDQPENERLPPCFWVIKTTEAHAWSVCRLRLKHT